MHDNLTSHGLRTRVRHQERHFDSPGPRWPTRSLVQSLPVPLRSLRPNFRRRVRAETLFCQPSRYHLLIDQLICRSRAPPGSRTSSRAGTHRGEPRLSAFSRLQLDPLTSPDLASGDDVLHDDVTCITRRPTREQSTPYLSCAYRCGRLPFCGSVVGSRGKARVRANFGRAQLVRRMGWINYVSNQRQEEVRKGSSCWRYKRARAREKEEEEEEEERVCV